SSRHCRFSGLLRTTVGPNGFAVAAAAVAVRVAREYLFEGRDMGPALNLEGNCEMTPLRKRMVEDMTLAGLAAGTKTNYLQAVRSLAAYYTLFTSQPENPWVR